jgi:PAS domain S-box-containing protein
VISNAYSNTSIKRGEAGVERQDHVPSCPLRRPEPKRGTCLAKLEALWIWRRQEKWSASALPVPIGNVFSPITWQSVIVFMSARSPIRLNMMRQFAAISPTVKRPNLNNPLEILTSTGECQMLRLTKSEIECARALVAESPLEMAVIDLENRFVAVSRGLVAQGSFTREQLLGATLHDLFTSSVKTVSELLLLFEDGSPSSTLSPQRVNLPSGEVIWVEVVIWPYRAQSGEIVGVVTLSRNITAEQKAACELSRAKVLLDAVVENIPSMLAVRDLETRSYVRVNRATEEFLGKSREHILGGGRINISEDDLTLARWADIVRGEAPAHAHLSEEILHDGGDRPRLLRVSRQVIEDDEGLKHLLSIAQDITEVRQAEEALRTSAATADAANRAKSEFLANMSHEIRTPLNGVMGIASALARTSLSPHQAEMVELIETSAQTLEALLGDILDLARIESGHTELRAESFDLAASVNAAAGVFAAAAKAKGLGYCVAVDPDALGSYVGDAARLRQIISNLLGNAVKFTSQGAISLTVSAELGESTSKLQFDVRDTGIGFDAATKTRLFARFEQADGSITRRFGGTGLGLAISSSLARTMGGTLDATSECGKGAVFTLTLELPRSSGDAFIWAQTQETVAQPDRLTGFRVLVAEDHPTNRRVVELILGTLDLDLTCVENGAEAVEAARRDHFDLILMDMQMPVMDGLTAIRKIRESEGIKGGAPAAIYTLTANAMPEDVTASLAAGANGHLSKPIAASALIATVDAVSDGDHPLAPSVTPDDQAIGMAPIGKPG